MASELATPKFFYFDFGNVLCSFSHEQAANQMAHAASIPYELVWDVVFGSGALQIQYEMGELNSEQFFSKFCDATQSTPNYDAFLQACAAMFEPLPATWAIAASLSKAHYSLGILSNTCQAHWHYCQQRFKLLHILFPVQVLSYEVQCMKPLNAIYAIAQQRAGCEAAEIFFVDDRPENVWAAQSCGFQAVLFQTPFQLQRELLSRGVRTNF